MAGQYYWMMSHGGEYLTVGPGCRLLAMALLVALLVLCFHRP